MGSVGIYVFPSLAFGVLAAWIALVVWLFHRLRVQHPATFRELGEPDLLWNNSTAHLFRFLRFLFGGEWHQLGDAPLAIGCHAARAFLAVYFLGFALMTVLFFAQLPPST